MREAKRPLFYLNEEVYIEPMSGAPGFKSLVVGVKPDHCVILDLSQSETDTYQLKVHDAVWVRCFKDAVFRFRSQILNMIEEPVPLIFVEYPRSVEDVDLRSGDRKKIFIRGEFLDLGDSDGRRSWEGYILDISDSGCLIWGDFVHLMDKDVLLSFQIPWSGESIQTKARVMRCEVTEKGIRSGLMFIDMTPDTHRRLQEFIGSLMEHQLSRITVKESPD